MRVRCCPIKGRPHRRLHTHTHIIVRSASRRRSPGETGLTPVDGQSLTGLCDRIRHRVGYIDPSESFPSQKQSKDGGRSQEVVEHGE
jgi:hypothetical protein